MAQPLSQNEAIEVLLGVTTAMLSGDKEAREILYSDLSEDDLKRVLRWAVRWFLDIFVTVSVLQGANPQESWQAFVLSMQERIAAEEQGDSSNDDKS